MLHLKSRNKKLVRLGALFMIASLTAALAGAEQTKVHSVDAAYQPEYPYEAEYNALSANELGTGIFLPFVNSDPAWKWQTTAIVENAGAASALVTLRYYSTAGVETSVITDTLAAGASRAYPTTGIFSGSLYITSAAPLAVIANETLPNSSGDGLESYQGVSGGASASSLSLWPIYRSPQSVQNLGAQQSLRSPRAGPEPGWDSIYAVQNLGAAATVITSTFYNPSATVVLTDTLPPWSAHYYDAAAIGELGSGFAGQVGVRSDGQPIAGVVHAINSLTGNALAYNSLPNDPYASLAPRWLPTFGTVNAFTVFLPDVADTSAITLYNLGSSTGIVQLAFYDQSAACANSPIFTTVPANATRTISRPDVLLPIGPCSAVVSSDQPMVDFVNTTWPLFPTTFTGYIGANQGSTTAFLPYVRKLADNAVTQIIVQNAGSATASVTLTYTDEIGNLAGTDSATIPPGAAHRFDQASSALPNAFSGSAVVTSNQPIVALGFISLAPIHSISGRVTDSSSHPIPGVTVSVGAAASAITQASGDYTLTNLLTGTYTLTPTLNGYSFSPPTRTVSVPPDVSGQDFTGIHYHQLDLPLVVQNYLAYFAGPCEVEHNDTYLEANGPLQSGKGYCGYSNAGEPGGIDKDYFSVYLPTPGTLTLDLTNYHATGQLQLYYQDTSHLVCLATGPSHHVAYTGSAGWYYIDVATVSGFNATPYTLRATYPNPAPRACQPPPP